MVFEVSEKRERIEYEQLTGSIEQFVEEAFSLPSLEALTYEEGVRVIYKWLQKYDKTPENLAYDLLNEMVRELYAMLPDRSEREIRSFRLSIEDRCLLGSQLRDLRIQHGVGPRELARSAQRKPTQIMDIEARRRKGQRKYTPGLRSLSIYLTGLKSVVENRLK
ncbi:MAG: hypothetical protein QXJ20_01745 [Candidatus Aenigmatarchaeota archaeon]